jgi:hypothetical protein
LDKVNHGPCKICGGPILYLGSNFCGPKCNNIALQPGSTVDIKISTSRSNFAPTPVSLPESESELVKPENTELELVVILESEMVVSVPEEFPEEVVEMVVLPEVSKPPKKPEPPKKPKLVLSESIPPPELKEQIAKKLYL